MGCIQTNLKTISTPTIKKNQQKTVLALFRYFTYYLGALYQSKFEQNEE
jgi:hypothetical protein